MAKVKKANKKPAKKTVSKKTAKSKSRTVKKKPVVKKNKPTNARKTIKKKTTIKKKVKKAAPQRSKVKANLKKIVKTVKKARKATVNKVKAVVKKVTKKIAKVKVVKTVNKKVEQIKNKKNPIVASSIAGSKKPVLVKGKLLVQTGKPRIDQEEKLHSKAQRIMKELEETMDMDKVKPRIKVPTFIPPKPKPAPVVKLPEPTNTKKEKYQLEWTAAFEQWVDEFCKYPLFLQAVLDLTVFLPDNRHAQLAESRMNHFILKHFEVKFHKSRGLVEMKVA